MPRYILALDQGTTSSRAMLFDEAGRAVAIEQREFAQSFPHLGWVEHDPEAIWSSQIEAARGVLRGHGVAPSEIVAIGITNQRETALVWDRATGEPIYPAVVWQSRQTVPICDDLRAMGLEALVRERTGLRIDAYFSATKVRFILDAVPGAQARAERGELAFGTVDSWLLHRLTSGRVHATDETNASRTMLYDIRTYRWDDTLLAALEIPRAMLPEVRPSSGDFGEADATWFGAPIPIRGVAGDQQAALFGQGRIADGGAKNTYGTGCFMLTHTGSTARPSDSGLLTTVAARTGGEAPAYALEGSVFVAGAAVQWLRDGLGLVRSAAETDAIARSVPDTGGVYVVPAFTGLGAPYWDEAARGTIVGLTRGSGAAHIVRATLEAIAYQTRDLVECFAADAGRAPVELRVDGGACRNDFLMQFQADILGIPVRRPAELEVTALGAAGLAGIASGVWGSASEFAAATSGDLYTFEPRLPAEQRGALHAGWLRAVERARGWAVD
ncbi:MAG: glycerol kinase [Chloroflexi bacterium HGW-Chloroflexi-9]|nr:MAG: glycerol kinase [Chloroflexi bacterium HGW-Chloroflexi-9]